MLKSHKNYNIITWYLEVQNKCSSINKSPVQGVGAAEGGRTHQASKATGPTCVPCVSIQGWQQQWDARNHLATPTPYPYPAFTTTKMRNDASTFFCTGMTQPGRGNACSSSKTVSSRGAKMTDCLMQTDRNYTITRKPCWLLWTTPKMCRA